MKSIFRIPLIVLFSALLLLPAAAQPPGVSPGLGLGLSVDAECAFGNEVDVSRAKGSVAGLRNWRPRTRAMISVWMMTTLRRVASCGTTAFL